MVAAAKSSNVVLVSGSDPTTIHRRAEQLVRDAAGENPDAFALDVVAERDDMGLVDVLNQVVVSVLSPPFLGGRKTVWLQHFSAFENEGAKSDKSARAQAFRKLAETIAKGVGDDIVLVLSGPGIDKRKALYKACKAHGTIVECNKPDVRGRRWQEDMSALVLKAAAQKGMQLAPDVCRHLVQILGTDTARIDPELEKLLCYCGGADQPVRLADARAICQGHGESMSWSMLDAISKRKLGDAFGELDLLLRQSKDPEGAVIGLVIQLAGRFRQLLQMRLLMQWKGLRDGWAVKNALNGLDAESKKAAQARGLEVVSFHPYRAQMLAEQALAFSGPELVTAMSLVRDANWQCISSSTPKRVVLERLIAELVGSADRGAGRGRRGR